MRRSCRNSKAPTAYNPKNHPEKNQQRRDKILNNMKEQGYITEEEYTIAMNDNVYDRIAHAHAVPGGERAVLLLYR